MNSDRDCVRCFSVNSGVSCNCIDNGLPVGRMTDCDISFEDNAESHGTSIETFTSNKSAELEFSFNMSVKDRINMKYLLSVPRPRIFWNMWRHGIASETIIYV